MQRSRHFALFVVTILILFIATTLGLVCSGAEAKKKEITLKYPSMAPVEEIPNNKKLTFDDVLNAEYVSEMSFSPDGSCLVWCKDFSEHGMKTRAHNIFLTYLSGGKSTQLTFFNGATISGVKFSPDGGKITFLCDAPPPGTQGSVGKTVQVWAVGPDGQDLSPMTSLAQDVLEYGWRDSKTLLYTARAGGLKEGVELGDNTIHVSDYCEAPVRLFQLDLQSGKTMPITQNKDRIFALSVSPDGKWAFYVRTMGKGFMPGHDYYANIAFSNYLLDLESGDEKKVLEMMRATGGAVWSPDSKTLYAVDLHYEDPNPYAFRAEALALDLSTGTESSIDLQWPKGMEMMSPLGLPNSPIRPIPGGFLAFLADGCNPKLARYTRFDKKWGKTILEGQHQGNIFYVEVSPNGETVCYDHSNASKPPQIYKARLKGGKIVSPREITSLNSGFKEKNFAPSETITWEGARGDPVEGILFYPEGYKPDKRYPLMLVIHGGPWECDKDRWQSYQWIAPYHILSQKGAFVLAPNYHGSTGYGQNSIDFATSIQKDMFYPLITEDIEKGMNMLIELSMVNDNRLGTMGWSCGSIISNMLIVHDQRFKVASCGAGGAEWLSQWGGSMFGDVFVKSLFGRDPIEDPNLFQDPARAPFYNAAKVKTPVIMFQPAEDVNVAPNMTWITYRGIQKHGNAPVELYIFPGEGHVPLLIAHQKRKLVEEQKWFDKYFFGNPENASDTRE
jgi:dipeptidyl aminopeptidase/acylaminoacyl peptidase